MRELDIVSVGISPTTGQHVVILRDRANQRYLPIWIGSAEANAIAIRLQGAVLDRPLSHDLLLSVIGNLKGSIDSVVISDLKNDVFYGEIIINVAKELIEVDCRPSDAVALAVRAEVPIFAEDKVLDIAGITVESTKDKAEPQEKKAITEEELKRLSAFTDFIDELNIDDFGEDKPKDK